MPRSFSQQDYSFSKFYNTQLLAAAALTLDGTYVYSDNLLQASVAQTLTIPANLSEAAWPLGSQCTLTPIGTAGVSISPATNVTLNGGTSPVSLGTTAYGGFFTLKRIGANNYLLLKGIASSTGIIGSAISGYIDGFQLSFVSSTEIQLSSGNCYVPGTDSMLASTSTLTVTGTQTSGALRHAYVYNNAGTPAIDLSTTAPDTPYSGTARTKTGDTSRRYVGSIGLFANHHFVSFTHVGNLVMYTQDADQRIVLNGGVADTTPTSIDCSLAVPITATAIACVITNTDTAQTVNFGGSNSTILSIELGPSSKTGIIVPCTPDPFLYYFYNSAPSTGNFTVTVTGFYFGR